MRSTHPESGEVRARTLVEIALIFIVGYTVFQVAPTVVVRMNFLNELEVIANSPIQDTAGDLRRRVLETAEGYGIVVRSDQLIVERDRSQQRTIIDIRYQLPITFFLRFVYTWNVRDRVEALLL